MSQLQRRLGRTIRRLRTDAGYSQEGFADKVDIHRTTMSKVERGLMNLSLAMLERLAKGLGLPLSDLIAAAETPPSRSDSRRSPTAPVAHPQEGS